MCEIESKHGESSMKPVESMQICALAIKYCMELVEIGDMQPIECEECIINWLCGDGIEICMDPNDAIQWYTQCTRPVEFWVECIEATMNSPEFTKYITHHQWYSECAKSMFNYMELHNLKVKLVEK